MRVEHGRVRGLELRGRLRVGRLEVRGGDGAQRRVELVVGVDLVAADEDLERAAGEEEARRRARVRGLPQLEALREVLARVAVAGLGVLGVGGGERVVELAEPPVVVLRERVEERELLVAEYRCLLYTSPSPRD